jgi:cobyrinic acid a,c-diamide synthase
MTKAIVIAGTASGVGKTTITLGLLEAFKRRGLRVQAFKVGPDFIDPGLHALVTGCPSYNLDAWICPREHVLETVSRHARDADLALIEGVMGCFDGYDAKSDAGSTAELAKWLGAPVVLVMDAAALARSAGAVVLGFERFDPELHVAAVIFNRVGGELHAQWLKDAVERSCQAIPLGAVIRDDALALPERHLGLVTALEGVLTGELRDRLAHAMERSVDLDRLLDLAAPLRLSEDPIAQLTTKRHRARIGIARDVAFQFYYPENLELLEAAGAELVFWSPLRDRVLPEVDGLYFGGGYPELHARALSENLSIREAVKRFADGGKPIYAECGGLMFLADALEDLEGNAYPMVGILPTTVRMLPRRLTLGYTEVEFTAESPLGAPRTQARGHEYHYSTLDPIPSSVQRVYTLRFHGGGERAEGYLIGSVLMSYVHLHFGSNPEIPVRFVDACARERSHRS